MFKATNIMPLEMIAGTCNEIQAFLEAHYNADVSASVVDRANELESYMAISGKMLADAKYHLSEVMNSIFIKAVKDGIDAKMGTTTLNKYIDSICRDYEYLVNWSERINRTCTHQLDMCRTILSKLKAEMQAAQFSTHS